MFNFPTNSFFESSHAEALIKIFWRTFEDARSQIVTWLEHLTNLLFKIIAVSDC